MAANSYEELIERAYDGFLEIESKSPDELKRWLATQPLVPPNVPVKAGFLHITESGLDALREIGRVWRQNNPQYHRVITDEAAEKTAITAFGDLIDAAKMMPDDTIVKTAYLKLLEERISNRLRAEHFYFPVHAFEHADVGTFQIGPVTVFRRDDWLDHVEKVANAPLPWKKDVLNHWHTARSWWKELAAGILRVFGREHRSQREADRILNAVGPCRWVVAVLIRNQERDRAQQCAAVAANIAIESLGLPLLRTVARNLRGPGHETAIRKTERISQFEGAKSFNTSTSIDVPRIGGRPGSQSNFLGETHKLRRAVGDALSAFVEVAPATAAPKLKQRWVEAMYWFGQARREDDEFIALVKYGIALDILAKGGKARGILALCTAVLDMTETDIITSDGRELNKVVKALYDDGRSQIAHGGRLALLTTLRIPLSLADGLSSHVLIGYVACLERHAGNDEYEEFLGAIPDIRAKIASE